MTTSNKLRLLKMEVHRIRVPEGRRPIREESIEPLMQSIEALGLQQPITVREDEGGEHYIVAGRHRLEAITRLGWDIVECSVFLGTETQARMWALSENLARAELTGLERAEQQAEWMLLREGELAKAAEASAHSGHSRKGGHQTHEKQAAEDIGLKRTNAQRAKVVASLTAEAKDVARELGLDGNVTVLLRARKAGETAEAQVSALRASRDAKKEPEDAPGSVKGRRVLAALRTLDVALLLADMRAWSKHERAALIVRLKDVLKRVDGLASEVEKR